ncbi:COG4223 family protein [Sulfitobacter sp. JB4-11]|uniref:COG4223 family protein n=1 Tax=Sulfitobacter rhodophyticola TaxID=3238304 RepID=UPI003D81A5DB
MANSKKPASKTSDTAGSAKANATAPKADKGTKQTPASKVESVSAKPDPTKPADTAAEKKTVTAATKDTVTSKPTDAKPTPVATDKAKDAKEVPVAKSAASTAGAKAAASDATSKPAAKEAASAPSKPATSTPAKPAASPPAPQKSGSAFWPLVLGGIIAGVIGFIAAEMNVFGLRARNDTLSATVQAQADRIAQLEDTVANAAAPEMPDVAPLQAELGTLNDTVAALGTKVEELANRPIVTTSGDVDVSAYEAQLGALQASVVAQKEELDQLLANAQSVEQATAEAARLAVIQGALTDIGAALTEGAPFSDALGVLSENGVDDIPAALSDTAEEGVPTLSALQSGFTGSARAALGAARSAGVQEGEEGFGGFLRRSLGARSVAPREGSDPDAVLSRAEAALRDGALGDALSELDTLPAAAQDAMGSWLSDARSRAAARDAAEDLSERLTAN